MRGFEEDDRRVRTGGLGGSNAAARPQKSAASLQHCFAALEALPVPSTVKPSQEAALRLLRALSNDPAVLAILAEHRWTVGALKEMPPEGLVGVSASCLMGLNRNRGQEIILRLRTDDWCGLRPYAAVIDVLMHELAHNVHDEHDADFKALNSQLKREYVLHRSRLSRGQTVGGSTASELCQPSADEVSQVVGGAAPLVDARTAAAQAALARSRPTAPPPVEEACVQCELFEEQDASSPKAAA